MQETLLEAILLVMLGGALSALWGEIADALVIRADKFKSIEDIRKSSKRPCRRWRLTAARSDWPLISRS